MSILRPTVADDRGKPVPLIKGELHALGAGTERHKRLEAALLGPREPWTASEIRGFVMCGAVGVPLFLLAAILPAYLLGRTHVQDWVYYLGWVPMLVGIIAAPTLVARHAAGRRVAREYIRAGYCGSCGYDLQSGKVHDDGCRVCPECGAAWRSDDRTIA